MDEIALLEGLLLRYSPSGEEAGAASFLVEQMQANGLQAHLDAAGNAVGVKGSGGREILLLGHIDTVAGFIEVNRQGNSLYGRGAVDAKGALACFVAAAVRVNPPAGYKVTVIGAVGEEASSPGAKFLMEHRAPPEMVVIGEPSGWEHITLGYKGSARFSYTLRQPLAHTAARGTRVSACETAVQFWNNLKLAANTSSLAATRLFDQLTPSLGSMHSSSDGFSEMAVLKISLRIPLGLDEAAVTGMLARLGEGAEVQMEDFIPAFRAEKNTLLVRALLAGIRAQKGQPGFTVKTGTSDMNLVGPAWKCPIAAYGPGDSNLDHTPQEHILISEYLTSIEVLVDALERIMNGKCKGEA